MALALAGFDVREAGDGLQALQIVDAAPPDAIVLDLGLPRMHGRAVHEELRRHTNTRSIPVIIVTGSVQPAADESEAACVLTKPVSSDELVHVVRKCLACASDGGE
jgi:CheY-like chemotaxis protein